MTTAGAACCPSVRTRAWPRPGCCGCGASSTPRIAELLAPPIDLGYLSLPAELQASIEQDVAEHRKGGSDVR